MQPGFNGQIDEVTSLTKKLNRLLWKFLNKIFRGTYILFTGKEPQHHWFAKGVGEVRTGIGEQLSKKERLKAVEADGVSKTVTVYNFEDPTEAFMFIEKLSHMESSYLKDNFGNRVPVKFLITAVDENNEKIKLTPHEASKIGSLEKEFLDTKQKYLQYEREFANNPTNKNLLKKRDEWFIKMNKAEQNLNSLRTYVIGKRGHIRVYLNSSYDKQASSIKAMTREQRMKDLEDYEKGSLEKEIIQRVSGSEFQKETKFQENGLYGPMTKEEIGANYYFTKVSERDIKKLQDIPNISDKSFSIEKRGGNFFLLVPQDINAVKEMTATMGAIGITNATLNLFKDGKCVLPTGDTYKMPIGEWEKAKGNELDGTTYDQFFTLVNGELQTTLSDYTLPDGSKGENALERYADKVRENRDKQAYEEQQQEYAKEQEAIIERPEFALRSGKCEKVEDDIDKEGQSKENVEFEEQQPLFTKFFGGIQSAIDKKTAKWRRQEITGEEVEISNTTVTVSEPEIE